MQSRHAAIAVLTLSLLALASLAAGCGGGSPSSAVASLGPSGAATTRQSGRADSGPSSGSSSATGGGPTLSIKTANGAKFAACMRSHGVPRFPDPNGQGAITIGPSMGVDPNTSKFKAAQQTCQKLLPNGGQPSPAEQAKGQQQMLEFSACMRKHGVPHFPDPTFSGGHIQLSIKG